MEFMIFILSSWNQAERGGYKFQKVFFLFLPFDYVKKYFQYLERKYEVEYFSDFAEIFHLQFLNHNPEKQLNFECRSRQDPANIQIGIYSVIADGAHLTIKPIEY